MKKKEFFDNLANEKGKGTSRTRSKSAETVADATDKSNEPAEPEAEEPEVKEAVGDGRVPADMLPESRSESLKYLGSSRPPAGWLLKEANARRRAEADNPDKYKDVGFNEPEAVEIIRQERSKFRLISFARPSGQTVELVSNETSFLIDFEDIRKGDIVDVQYQKNIANVTGYWDDDKGVQMHKRTANLYQGLRSGDDAEFRRQASLRDDELLGERYKKVSESLAKAGLEENEIKETTRSLLGRI